MFLAVNEIKHDKLKFALIISVVGLISYLTYFLTGLAYGLASSYTQGIDKWNADSIILNKNANDNIARSLLNSGDYSDVNTPQANKAKLGVSAGVLELPTAKEDVSIFGYESGSFVEPNIVEGQSAKGYREVVVSADLKQFDIKVGDDIIISNVTDSFKVVGFSDNANFQALPLVYTDISTWRDISAQMSGMNQMKDDSTFSAVVVKDENNIGSTNGEPSVSDTSDADKISRESSSSLLINKENDTMRAQSIKDFAYTLPGYSAQVATFGTMIGFLIFISSFVLSMFIYILTVQKKNVFGILKAEGVPSSYISWSVQFQVLILVVVGVLSGLLLTLLSAFALGNKIPFAVQPVFFLAVTLFFLVCALIGGVLSVRSVVKIDPVKAIS